MSFPSDLRKITTNLPLNELEVVVQAIKEKVVSFTGGSLFSELGTSTFEYQGESFEMTEMWETVQSIYHKVKPPEPRFWEVHYRSCDGKSLWLNVVSPPDWDEERVCNELLYDAKFGDDPAFIYDCKESGFRENVDIKFG